MTQPTQDHSDNRNSRQPLPPFGIAGAVPPSAAFPKPGFFKFLVGLFLFPRLAILSARYHKMWFRTLFIIVAAAVIAAVLQGVIAFPKISKACTDVSAHCAKILTSLSYSTTDNTIGWGNTSLAIPYSDSTAGWRLDVLNAKADFNRQAAIDSSDEWGILVCKDAIGFWSRNIANPKAIVVVDNLPMKNFAELFRQLGQPRDNSLVLEQGELERLGLVVAPGLMLFMALQECFTYLQIIFTCVVIFVLMSLFFNRIDKAPFPAVVASSFACTIPPYLLALGASLFSAVTLDVDTLFTIFFVIYLIVIFCDRSVLIRRSAAE